MQTKKDLSKSSNNDQHNYLSAFTNLEHKLENMFNKIWHRPLQNQNEQKNPYPMSFNDFPKMDIVDRDKEIFVKAELPGIDKEDIDISITNNHLFIKAKTRKEEKEEKGDYLRQEIISSEFYRSIHLPVDVDDDKIKTSFKNGVLEMTIPKQEQSHRRRIKLE